MSVTEKTPERFFDFDVFKDYMTRAIGDRTKAEYARAVGMSPQRLNTLLNNPTSVPTIATLKKLAMAAQNDITLMDLASAVGYLPEDVYKEDKVMSKRVERASLGADGRNELAEKDLLDALADIAGSFKRYKDIQEVIDTFNLVYSVEDYTFEILDPVEEECTVLIGGSGLCNRTAQVYPIIAKWNICNTENLIPFVLYTIQDKDYLVIISYSVSAAFMEDHGILPEKIKQYLGDDDLTQYVPAHIILDSRAKNGNDLLRNLELQMYQGELYGEYPETCIGIGFKVCEWEDDKIKELIDMDTFRKFADKHKDVFTYGLMDEYSYTDSELWMQNLIKSNYDTPNEVTYYEMTHFIEKVMAKETGLAVHCHTSQNDGEDNLPVIMVELEDINTIEIPEETVYEAMHKYAKELGIQRYGKQYYTWILDKEESDEFEVGGSDND